MKAAATAVLAEFVVLLAFLLYDATLLPGLDFGDTPSFQVMAGSPIVTPRDGYPLYFAIGGVFTAIGRGEPARALNLASAVEAAAACGVLLILAVELSGSVAAGAAATALFAVSYTFWSQAVIAEVYALHILLTSLTLLTVLWWDRDPARWRFVCVLAAYALSFGNHLTSILLAPALVAFIGWRRGWRFLFARDTIALAAGCASAGALLYLWNLRALWLAPLPPATLAEGLRAFWFDVTKADWRASMVAEVPSVMIAERLRMYAFDLHQQFGWTGPILAALGTVHLARTSPARSTLMVVAYIATVGFALSYNVGDTHVFLLPSHLIVALLASAGIVGLASIAPIPQHQAVAVVAILTGAAALMTGYDNFPAMNRSGDHRGQALLEAATAGVDERRAIFVADLNWQIDNGLNYLTKRTRHDVAYVRLPSVLPHLPALVRDNEAIGRRIVLAGEAAGARVDAAHGSAIVVDREPSSQAGILASAAQGLPPGTRYALTLLRPLRDTAIDQDDLQRALRALTGSRLASAGPGDFVVVAGLTGEAPTLLAAGNRPFRASAVLNGLPIAVRMESWLAFDTIRRMGFGHVIAGRQHTLIAERGASFAAFDDHGLPLITAYAANIFAPIPRFTLRTP